MNKLYLPLLLALSCLGCNNQKETSIGEVDSHSVDTVIIVENSVQEIIPISKVKSIFENDSIQREVTDRFDTTFILNKQSIEIKFVRCKDEKLKFDVEYEFTEGEKEIYWFDDYALDLEVSVDNSIIYSKRINKFAFSDYYEDKNFLKYSFLSIVNYEGLDESKSNLNFKIMIPMIESDYAYIFMLKINLSSGEEKVEVFEVI